MTVFDAATPEGKRMRNQRKDSKVLRDMIATSKVVEPAEISYHANGEFRGSRDIFGPLSTENSPVSTSLQLWLMILTSNRSSLSVQHQRSEILVSLANLLLKILVRIGPVFETHEGEV
jgi:hypothetical protein